MLRLFASGLNIKDLDRSVNSIEQALARIPDDPSLLSDLSALLIERGETRSDPNDFFLAISVSSKAIAINPLLSEAQFNLALALDHLYLESEACKAWSRYLDIDNESEWSYEAAARCRRSRPVSTGWEQARKQLDVAVRLGNQLEVDAIVQKFPRSARLFAQRELIGDWEKSNASGERALAEHYLQIARAIGSALVRDSGDYMVAQSVEAIISSGLGGLSASRVYAPYIEGLKLSDQELDSQAFIRFDEGARRLAKVKSPLSYYAELKAATCLLYMGKPERALERLTELTFKLEERRYPTLMGEVLWIQGLAYSKLANFPAAFLAYSKARKLFANTGEAENVAFISFLLAENLRYQGQPRRALLHLIGALGTIRTMGFSLWYHNSLFEGAELALKQNFPEVALFFQNEMVEESTRADDPIAVTEALLRRARTLQRLHKLDEAVLDLQGARKWVGRIESGRRESLTADIAMIAAGIQVMQKRFSAAISSLTAAVEEAEAHGRVFRLPDLFEAKGNAHMAAGDYGLAEQSFRRAINELLSQRESTAEFDLRSSYFERSQQMFDALIRIKLEQGKAREIFDLIEESRSRTLLGRFQATHLSQAEVCRNLPVGVGILEYRAMDQGILIFFLSRDRFHFSQILTDKATVRAKVDEYQNAIRTSNRTEEIKIAQELYELLILPARASMQGIKYLVLAPDDFLAAIPYASLINPRTKRFLLEEKVIAFAPSASGFLYLSAKESILRGRPFGKLLVVNDPAFNLREFPDLLRLRGAQAEGRDLEALGATEFLSGRWATPPAFSDLAPRHSFVHIAAHVRLNHEYASQSALILASVSKYDNGLLLARDIYRLRFVGTRLVVLAACNGAQGESSRGEGVDSLERAFLGAGVPSVVASLWEVDDRLAGSIFINFYGNLRKGLSIPESLQAAQLSFMKNSPESTVQAWSGFRVFGGFTF